MGTSVAPKTTLMFMFAVTVPAKFGDDNEGLSTHAHFLLEICYTLSLTPMRIILHEVSKQEYLFGEMRN